jgi:hypothetical protein
MRLVGHSRAGGSRQLWFNTDRLSPSEAPVSDSKQPVRLTLTEDQKAQIRNQTGKDAESVELSVSELEDRIAPLKTF